MSKNIFLLLLLISGMLFFSSPLYIAAASDGLIISPAFQEILLDQTNKNQEFTVSLTNNTNTTITLKLSMFDFGSLDESGGVAFLGASNDLENKYSLASWMRPEKEIITLTPYTTEDIRVAVENSASLSPGGHYGALAFQTDIQTNITNDVSLQSVAIQQLFSTLVFVKKIGGEIYGLDFKEQEYNNAVVKFQDTLRLRFQNTGNVHLTPRGIAMVTDPLGRVVAKGIINPESGLILPETSRVYAVHLNTVAMSFVPGWYTIEIAYRYDGKEDLVTTISQFIFIPPLTILVFLVLIILGWYAVMKNRNKTGAQEVLFEYEESTHRKTDTK